MEQILEDQSSIARKVVNMYSSVTNLSSKKVTIGLLDSKLEKLDELWSDYKTNHNRAKTL